MELKEEFPLLQVWAVTKEQHQVTMTAFLGAQTHMTLPDSSYRPASLQISYSTVQAHPLAQPPGSWGRSPGRSPWTSEKPKSRVQSSCWSVMASAGQEGSGRHTCVLYSVSCEPNQLPRDQSLQRDGMSLTSQVAPHGSSWGPCAGLGHL